MRNPIFNYRAIFDGFGYPLKRSHALPVGLLRETEKRLGISIPSALREYYLVAGKETRFNRCHARFLHPSKWFLHGKHIAFLEENQSVCWWGVSVKTEKAHDPSVSQGVNDGEIIWNKEHNKCSVFLTVMLHYQAVSGGFRFCGSAGAPDDVHVKLKSWNYVGEVNQLWAFSRQNQVVCIMAGNDVPFMPAMMLFAGGKTKTDLGAIEESLFVKLK